MKFFKFTNSCYELVNTPMTFHVARTYCQGKQLQLVEIQSLEENLFVAQLSPHHDLWIGLDDLKQEGKWVWSASLLQATGHFTAWRKGDPNNRGGGSGAHCALIGNEKFFGEWDNQNCHKKKRFVCELPGGEVTRFQMSESLRSFEAVSLEEVYGFLI